MNYDNDIREGKKCSTSSKRSTRSCQESRAEPIEALCDWIATLSSAIIVIVFNSLFSKRFEIIDHQSLAGRYQGPQCKQRGQNGAVVSGQPPRVGGKPQWKLPELL